MRFLLALLVEISLFEDYLWLWHYYPGHSFYLQKCHHSLLVLTEPKPQFGLGALLNVAKFQCELLALLK
jgi:hypothetical protein